MTIEELMALWASNDDPEVRFAAWIEWINSNIPGYPSIVPTQFARQPGTRSGNCETGHVVPTELFRRTSPEDAILDGTQIIMQCTALGERRRGEMRRSGYSDYDQSWSDWLKEMRKEEIKNMFEGAKAYADYMKDLLDNYKGS